MGRRRERSISLQSRRNLPDHSEDNAVDGSWEYSPEAQALSDQSRGPGHRLGLGECDDRQHAPAASRQIQPKLRGRRGQRDAAPGPRLEAMSMAARIRACPAQRWRVCQLGQRRPLYLQGTRPFRDQAAPAMARPDRRHLVRAPGCH